MNLYCMRAFVGIGIDNESVVSKLDEIRAELGVSARTNPIHLTLAFLGDIDERTAEQVGARLCSVVFGTFEIRIETLGAFGSKASPRVVWAGIGAGRDALEALADSVCDMVRPFGLAQDRRFVPHITLSRVKSGKDGVAGMLARHHSTVFGVQQVHSMSLVRSDPSSAGHTHSVIQTVGATV